MNPPAYVRFLLLAFYSAAIAYFMLIPSPPEPPSFLAWDKLQHAAAFAVYAALAAWAFGSLEGVRHPFRAALLAAALFGILTEVLQMTLTTKRSGDLGDLAADVFGAAAACVILAFARRNISPESVTP